MRLTEPLPLSKFSSGYLDAFRAIAALLVMLSHLRGLFFVQHSLVEPANYNILTSALYLATRFGHQSVMIFFVLSGLLISSSILSRIHQGSWSWIEYLIDRATRLYTVLIPGLLLGFAWDFLGLRASDGSGIYSSPPVPFEHTVPANGLSLIDFLGNLAFLQTRFVPVYGSNGPLWSLFNEFWYYILFPAFICSGIYAFKRSLAQAILCLSAAGLSVWILKTAMYGFAVWLLGCALSIARPSGMYFTQLRRAILIACTCVSLITLCLSLNQFNDLLVGASFSTLLYGLMGLQIPLSLPFLSYSKSMAQFSYSLYILHFPALFFIRSICIRRTPWQPDGRHLMTAALIALSVVIYAFAISRITEAKTPIVRARVRRFAVRLLPSYLLVSKEPLSVLSYGRDSS